MDDKRDDEELTIDFSKVTKFFKSKPKKVSEPTKEPVKESVESDDEISLDLSKIKNIFKKSKDTKVEEKEDEVSFDIGDMKSVLVFLNKYKVVFLILIALFLSVNFRMYPADLPITEQWARDSVNNYYRNQILGQINQQYPHLPDENKNRLVDEQFAELVEEQSDLMQQQIQQTSQQFKDHFQDDNGQTYLLAIDPYFWLRFVENIEENGHKGDLLVDGVPWDDHFLAPIGRPAPTDDVHIYFEYYLFKFMQIFDRDMYPMRAAFFAPIIISALSVIPAFFIARRLGGNIGGFFAAVMVAIHPAFITRTVGGFADTDAYNVLIPLLIAWLFLEAFEARKTKWTIILSAASGVMMGIYSKTWGGWWYIMDFLLGLGGLYFVYLIFLNRNKLKIKQTQKRLVNIVVLMAVFVIFSAIFTIVLSNSVNFAKAFTGPASFIRMKEIGSFVEIWPNVYTTVAEQNELALAGVISQIGGSGLFALAVMGILLMLLKKDRYGNIDIKYAALFGIWTGTTIFASTRGVRFMLLLVPAFSIGLGTFIGVVTKYGSKLVSKELKLNRQIAAGAIIIVMALLFITPFNQARNTAFRQVPSMNDAWVRSLTLIKTNSTEDAIINSWWDFGHWFKYWADRPVTFDGTSQVGDIAHFIGRTLLTDNEDEAIAILRMLDCGGTQGLKELDEETDDPFESVMLIKKIILMERNDAKRELMKYVDEEKAEEILELTHCDPPEDYFITSEDMVGKSGVWAHFGSWNFTKSDMVWRVKFKKAAEGIQILEDRFGLSTQMADQFYYEITTQNVNNWIAPWPSYASGMSGCTKDNDLISCGNGVKLNLTNEEAYIDTPQGKKHPAALSFIDEDGDFKEIRFEDDVVVSNDGRILGAAIIPDNDRYVSLLMSPELVSSMFTRLFYFKGYGLEHFDKFHFDRTISGLDIYVWKVDWEGS